MWAGLLENTRPAKWLPVRRMAEGENVLADTEGKFVQAVKNEWPLEDVTWDARRILLSDRRLVLVGSDTKDQMPLTSIDRLGDRYDVNQEIASVPRYLSLCIDDDVYLVAPQEYETFETRFFQAILNGVVVLGQHPAVEGGVVKDTDWEKVQLRISDELVGLLTEGGDIVKIYTEDIGSVDTDERVVGDEPLSILEVEHADGEMSVQTYLAGSERLCSFLYELFHQGEEESDANIEVDESEQEVLMALYSGVSPFEIPDFVGADVEEVEAIFERLVDLDVLDEVRKRREVTLTSRGRNLASEAMSER